MGVIKQIEVSARDRAELERIVAASSSEVRLVERARIVLAAGEGLKGSEIADRVECSERDGGEVAGPLCARRS